MTIRPATLEDLEPLRQLNTLIFEINHQFDPDFVKNFAQTETGKKYFIDAITDKLSCFLVATNENTIIGYTSGSPKDTPYRYSRYLELDLLAVHPDYQKQGIGEKLLDSITAWAKDHGFQKIYVESYFKNTAAINFYKNHGYSEIDISLEKSI